jgi:hypothetical protein
MPFKAGLPRLLHWHLWEDLRLALEGLVSVMCSVPAGTRRIEDDPGLVQRLADALSRVGEALDAAQLKDDLLLPEKWTQDTYAERWFRKLLSLAFERPVSAAKVLAFLTEECSLGRPGGDPVRFGHQTSIAVDFVSTVCDATRPHGVAEKPELPAELRAKIEEIRCAAEEVCSITHDWEWWNLQDGPRIEQLEDYGSGIPVPPLEISVMGKAIRLKARVEPALEVLYAHRCLPPFLRSRSLEEALAVFPMYPHGNIEIAKDKQFVSSVRESLPTLRKLRTDFRRWLTRLSVAPLSVINSPAPTPPDNDKGSQGTPPPDAEDGTKDNATGATSNNPPPELRRNGSAEDSNPRTGYQSIARFDAEDLQILRALKKATPRLLTTYDLEAASRISRKTVGQRLNQLVESGLADRPRGPKGGAGITEKGVAALGKRSARK